MRALVQRVCEASVDVDDARVAEIGQGLLVLVGVGHTDGPGQAVWLAAKIAKLRVFADAEGRMNLALGDIGGAALVVSQFTLYGDVTRGNRPSFVGAAPPDQGAALVEQMAVELERLGIPVGRGRFGAHMRVALVNDGPVTIWIESPGS